jgi:hypothetical protein
MQGPYSAKPWLKFYDIPGLRGGCGRRRHDRAHRPEHFRRAAVIRDRLASVRHEVFDIIICAPHIFVYLCVEVCIMRHPFNFTSARRNTGHASGIF